jgi:rsbT co-antagonist protein RsbR
MRAAANHFVQSLETSRLLGADVMMTGPSPKTPQTLINIGVDVREDDNRETLITGRPTAGIEVAEQSLVTKL